MKKIFLYLGVAAMSLSLTGCFNLDKEPEGQLASATAFATTSEIQLYLNQFYQGSIRYMGSGTGTVSNTVVKSQSTNVGNASGIAFTDLNSDNLIGNVIDTRLAGETALSTAGNLTEYYIIRNLNFLLQNITNCDDQTSTDYHQCLGEAYYFRAACYYQLLIKYGGVTWMEDLLDPDASLMQLPRNTRTEIADHILADLDLAIENLNAQSTNATMRVHKDVAYTLKSEVALFAATWEKYHRQKNTKFYDKELTNADAKINDWLTQARDAAYAVIRDGRWSIHNTGSSLTDYRDMFIDLTLADNNEVMWYKKYDAAAGIGHAVTRFLNMGGGICGVSASLVDDYLTIDGRPFVGNEKLEAKRTYGNELLPTVRDPRLSQTVAIPGQDLRPNGEYVYSYPPLNGNSYHQNTTGYSVLKYVEFNTTYQPTVDGETSSQAPAIQYRYADVLLNYAEALAELNGAGNAAEIQNALKPLRDRAGMPGVDFAREYNTDPSYPFSGLDMYIQAVRRERRVEKALEGTRLTDILRWAAADVLIVNKTPIGALYVGSNLEEQNEAGGFYNGELIVGSNLYLDSNGYIIPFNNASYPNGWQFNLERDYLQPIKQTMVQTGGLTNGAWEQNPGW